MQSRVRRRAGQRRGVFLSARVPARLRRTHLRGAGLLYQTPALQSGVRTAQEHREVLLLSRMEFGT